MKKPPARCVPEARKGVGAGQRRPGTTMMWFVPLHTSVVPEGSLMRVERGFQSPPLI